MPETGMYPKGGPKPGSGKPSDPPPGDDIKKEEVQVGPATFAVNYPIFDNFEALPRRTLDLHQLGAESR